MKIKVKELKAISEKLFQYMEKSEQDIIEIPYDYYWSILKEDRYDPYREPSEFTIGQLSDDFSELLRIATDRGVPVQYAFVWLGVILQSIGETITPKGS